MAMIMLIISLSLTDVTLDNRQSPTVIQLHIKLAKRILSEKEWQFSVQKLQRYLPSSCHGRLPYHKEGTLFLWPEAQCSSDIFLLQY